LKQLGASYALLTPPPLDLRPLTIALYDQWDIDLCDLDIVIIVFIITWGMKEILTRLPEEVYFLCFAGSIGSVAQDAELLGSGVLGSVERPGNHGQESDIDHSQEMGAAGGAPYRFCMG
jgi:hypothetical protein